MQQQQRRRRGRRGRRRGLKRSLAKNKKMTNLDHVILPLARAGLLLLAFLALQLWVSYGADECPVPAS